MKNVILRLISVFAIVAMAFTVSPIMLVNANSSGPRYNYKMGLESKSEFYLGEGYRGGSEMPSIQKLTPPYPTDAAFRDEKEFKQQQPMPEPPEVSRSFTEGVYGKAMSITYPGWYEPDSYWQMPDQMSEEDSAKYPSGRERSIDFAGYKNGLFTGDILVGSESISFVEYMKEVHTIRFWVQTPSVTRKKVNGDPAGERYVTFSFAASSNNGQTNYEYSFYLPNTGEWEYMSIPISGFSANNVKFANELKSNKIVSIDSFDVSFKSPTSNPALSNNTEMEKDTYFGKGAYTPRPPAGIYGLNGAFQTEDDAWIEPITIDELLFDRSTAANYAITPPSPGEEQYHNDVTLAMITVNGKPISNFQMGDVINEVQVPAGSTANDIKAMVVAHPASYDKGPHTPLADSASAQVHTDAVQTISGARAYVTPPITGLGVGTIKVVAANGVNFKDYKVRFVAKEGGEGPRYNYKMGLGAQNDFHESYGFHAGTELSTIRVLTPPYPNNTNSIYFNNSFITQQPMVNAPNITRSFPAGIYGNALSITYPGWYIPGSYWQTYDQLSAAQREKPMMEKGAIRYLSFATFHGAFHTNDLVLGMEQISFAEYMKDVHTIRFWVNTPKITQKRGNGCIASCVAPNDWNCKEDGCIEEEENQTANRIVRFAFGTDAGEYSHEFRLPNTGEWEYMSIPLSAFGNFVNDLKSGKINEMRTFLVHFNQATSNQSGLTAKTYFGNGAYAPPPPSGTYGSDGIFKTSADAWREPLMIDEMLFDRSTPENHAITPPSPGEEKYHKDTTLAMITVNGDPIENFKGNAGISEVPVPVNATVEDIKTIVEGHPAAIEQGPQGPIGGNAAVVHFDIESQTISGAKAYVNPPSSGLGLGTIKVVAADGTTTKDYQVNFVAREGVKIFFNEMEGTFNGALFPGENTITVPYANESAAANATFNAVAVARVVGVNDSSPEGLSVGQASAISTVKVIDAAPGAKDELEFTMNIPDAVQYLELYFFDDAGNSIHDSYGFTYGTNGNIQTGVQATSLSKTASLNFNRALFNDKEEAIMIEGGVIGANSGDSVLIRVNDPNGELVDIKSVKIGTTGEFNYASKLLSNDISGNYKVRFSVGGKVIESIVPVLSEDARALILNAFSNASLDSEYMTFYNTYYNDLKLSDSLFKRLPEAERLAALKAVSSADYIVDLSRNIEEQIVRRALNHFTSLDDMKMLYNDHNDTLLLPTPNYFVEYITKQTQLDKLLTKLVKGKYDTLDDARNRFRDVALAEAFNSVSNYGEVATLLNENKTQIGDKFNYATYNGLSAENKTAFYQRVVTANINEIENLNSYLTGSTNPGVGGVGGVGGGGGGGGGGVTASATVKNDPNVIVDIENASLFNDLEGFEWAHTAIEALAKRNIINGTGNGDFNPSGNVTREEFIKILVGALGISVVGEEPEFPDVAVEEWYYPFVAAASSRGIVNGYPDGRFGIGDEISREDLSVMVARGLSLLYGIEGDVKGDEFADTEEIADYAVTSVYLLRDLGIINGVGDNRFAPKQRTTRAEAAKLVYETLMYISKEGLSQ